MIISDVGMEPSRAEIDALEIPLVIEFGASWCAHCLGARPLIDGALGRHPVLRHFRVEDGPGRRLGRSFGIKLWPTLVFMNRAQEAARLVRPTDAVAIEHAITQVLATE